jgi:hypothetical protein
VNIGRRTFVKSGAALAALPLAGRAMATPQISVVLYDSRLPASRRFAAKFAKAWDVTRLHAENWAAFRAPLPPGTIAGLTSWSDLVIARGYAEEQGRRIRHERRQGQLFEWHIA